MMSCEQVAKVFRYHPPHGDQAKRYEMLRGASRDLAMLMSDLCPESRERSVAITKVQEAVMWANAAIAINEPAPPRAGD